MEFDAKTNDECASKYCSGFNKEWDGSKCKVKCTPKWNAKTDWSECVYRSQERTLSDGCGNEKNETRNCEPKCKDGAIITKTCPDGTLAIGKICMGGAWENVSNVCEFNQQEHKAVPPQSNGTANPCRGKALCFNGTITSVLNGDTLVIGGQKVQLALVDAPEYYQWGYRQAKKFTETLCKKGSAAIVDQDDLQPKDKYSRILGVVYCQGKNLNEELLLNSQGRIVKKYCRLSEFGDEEWAKEYGC